MSDTTKNNTDNKSCLEEDWHGKHYAFFSNRECEWFPCHENADKDNFSCLFCYCPLYALGDDCGGNFTYTEKGYKDCSGCLVPHRSENYGHMIKKSKQLCDMVNKAGGRKG